MSKIANPFEKAKHSERTVNQIFAGWINQISSELGLNYTARQETILADQKSPDIVIFDSDNKPVCVIELKGPSWDTLTGELVKKTYWEAEKIKAPYFATWNINKLAFFSTADYSKIIATKKSIFDALLQHHDIVFVFNFEQVEESDVKIKIQSFLKRFIEDLHLLYTKQKAVQKIKIDDYFIAHIHSTIDSLQVSYVESIKNRVKKDASFKEKIASWFAEQMWTFFGSDEDYKKIARQAAYLLINKILFYTALQEKFHLEHLDIPASLRSGSRLQHELQWFFDKILEIDYETVFGTNFIDNITFPEDENAIQSVRDFIVEINKHKLSEIGYDILGRLFENLIPEKERHNFGQYFTSSEVVDFILKFCLKSEKDIILDPSCGAGTFLVRAYQHKKLSNPRLKHADILPCLWGVDISKFATHLSTINIATKDLSDNENYPRIIHSDFFKIMPDSMNFKVPVKVGSLGKIEKKFEHPKEFDAIVGNPPYTRQEEMELTQTEGYKTGLIETALFSGGKKTAEISRRAGIHAYFFVHGTKFLKDKGRFGFVVSNSWLDVDYGKGLQEFFLKNYKIIAVVESEVERWFADADINTCILILEKCRNEKERNENIVKFVQLKKKLDYFIPKAGADFESELKRLREVEKLVELCVAHNEFYENDEIRVFPKSQKELWDEGFDSKAKIYAGAKWGKYIRAPQIFFKILEKCEKKLVPLKDVADVRFGIKTGANEFFYLTEEQISQFGIEKEFWMHKEDGKWVPNYVIKSPKECKSIIVNPQDLKYRVLLIHKDKKDLKGTNMLKYIEYGERQGFNERPTCAARRRWYDVGVQEIPAVLWFKAFNDRILAPQIKEGYNSSDRFYALYIKNRFSSKILSAYLNSTISYLFVELNGRVTLGEGALDNMTYETALLNIISPKLFDKHKDKISKAFSQLSSREIGSVFSEIGAQNPDEVSLEKVKPDRRELDKIIMGEILGLSDSEQIEVYKAIIHLVKSRIEKAKSVKKKSKQKGPNVEAIAERIIAEALIKLEKFPNEKKENAKEIILPKGAPEKGSDLKGFFIKINGEKIRCKSIAEAEFIFFAALNGIEQLNIPEKREMEKLLENYKKSYKKANEQIENYLSKFVHDRKMKEKIRFFVWKRLME